ncbi:hypothetical protein MNV49_002904 [Pseudohyphozyma bogoriensis]|nr:hypothetical protein MNV49_002904 [Pseudohyphozyma bogoriensis]
MAERDSATPSIAGADAATPAPVTTAVPKASLKKSYTPSRTNPPLIDASWRLVDSLEQEVEDDEDEWEEEEVTYVTLDFGRHVKPESYRQQELQLLAPESATPFAQIGASVFQGHHERLIGSEIILQQGEDGSYSPLTTSTHRIVFHPVNLTPLDSTTSSKSKATAKAKGKGKAANVDPDAPPRKRGRPKGAKNKTTLLKEAANSKSGEEPVKRGRGRPRKNALPVVEDKARTALKPTPAEQSLVEKYQLALH